MTDGMAIGGLIGFFVYIVLAFAATFYNRETAGPVGAILFVLLGILVGRLVS